MTRFRTPDEGTAAALRARLRNADPLRPDAFDAADEELALARVAARIDAERTAAALRPPARQFAFGAPALALVAVVAVAWLGVRFAERSRFPRPETRTSAGAHEAPALDSRGRAQGGSTVEPPSVSGSDEPESRQIQFETAGGTRVIWVLDPRFSLRVDLKHRSTASLTFRKEPLMRKHRPVSLAALALFALAAATRAQPAPAPTPGPGPALRSNADAPTPTPRGSNPTLTSQLVLLVADTEGAEQFENVPASAQKALRDVKGFLPYTSYRLLDLAWLRSSRAAEAQISGPDGRSLSASIRFNTERSDPSRIEIQRPVIVEAPRTPAQLLAPPKEGEPMAALAPNPLRPLLETSFGMKAGEMVVVGTAKLDGPSKALVVILSAIP